MDQGRARILVIDDDPKMGSVLRRALLPEHDVVVLTSAQEALDLVADGESFDLILCDLMLPGVDGVAFHERLGVLAPEMTGGFVIMTGGAVTQRGQALLARGDVPRLEKPFGIEELRRVVREHRLGGVRAPAGRASPRST